MTLLEVKDQILRVADIRRHMEFAGFRKATHGNRWYCAFHDDGNASVTVRENKTHCWSGCNRIWDTIEVETQATGETFTQVVKRLAHDYGIELDREKPQSPEQKEAIQRAWRRDSVAAELWKTGTLQALREELGDHKRILFPFHGLNEEASREVRRLTGRITTLGGYGAHRTVEAYREQKHSEPRAASALVILGQQDDTHARSITSACCGFLQAACAAEEDSTRAARHTDGGVAGGADQ